MCVRMDLNWSSCFHVLNAGVAMPGSCDVACETGTHHFVPVVVRGQLGGVASLLDAGVSVWPGCPAACCIDQVAFFLMDLVSRD